jgi:hypothetical protein
MKLTKNDYRQILDYYNKPYTEKMTTKILQSMCERIIAKKICSCIKKVKVKYENEKKDESRRIAICKNSVVTKKNINIHKFTCKRKPELLNKIFDPHGDKIYKNSNKKYNFK